MADRTGTEEIFLGQGVSEKLIFSPSDEQKLSLRKLPILNSVEDVAKLLRFTKEELVWLSYERKVSSVDHYVRFEIPKRKGGKRLIAKPKAQMRQAQERIRSEILKKLAPNTAAMAYRPGKSIVKNAKFHIGAKVLIRIDLKDFFPSITFHRVRDYFESLGYNPGVSTILALLTTDRPRENVKGLGGTLSVASGIRGLPQGACTSPDLANLIASKLDSRLFSLTRSMGTWRYTRYADDLTFSCVQKTDVKELLGLIRKIIASEGFQINPEKTLISRPSTRMMVTGLQITENSVEMTRRDIKRMRAFFHQCESQGLDEVSDRIGKNAYNVARGYIAYMNMISPELATKYQRKHRWLRMPEASAESYVNEVRHNASERRRLNLPVAYPPSATPWDQRDCIRTDESSS